MEDTKKMYVFEARANPNLQIGLDVLREGVKTKEHVKFVQTVFVTADPVLAQALLSDERCAKYKMYRLRPTPKAAAPKGAEAAAKAAAAREAAQKKAQEEAAAQAKEEAEATEKKEEEERLAQLKAAEAHAKAEAEAAEKSKTAAKKS